MPNSMEAHSPLRLYAIRATQQYKLVLDEVTPSNRHHIVHTDVGAEGVPIHYRADGIVVFDFPQITRYSGGEIPAWDWDGNDSAPGHIAGLERTRAEIRTRRYRYMNAFLTCFNSAFPASHHLEPPCNPNRYILVVHEGGVDRLMDNGSCDLAKLPFFPPLSVETLATAAQAFRSLEGEDMDLRLDLLDLYYRSAFHKDNLELGTSLILSWAIIERCQNLLWDSYIKGGYRSVAPNAKIAGRRRETLLTDRNYTAAIKTQILALGNVYHDQEVEWLDKARKKRNDYMHSLGSIDHMDSFTASLAAARLLQKVMGYEPRPFGGSSAGWDYMR